LLIEEFSSGEEFRILATKDSLLGVIKRIPANVIGDGIKTIEQLITEKNTDPRRGDNYTYSLLKIIIDEEVLSLLQEQNLSLSSVPEKNERILLRKKSNISTGGDSIDVTDQIHKNIRVLATNIVRAIPSLPYAAIDFITKDISANPFDIGYSVVEINSSPMLSMHHEPYKGVPRNVSKEIIKLIDHE
jgi:D-alanine-D-alanine ligase-like ATP-grasp enzyme